jgi:hypothetical protein
MMGYPILMTVDYLEALAREGKREAFDAVLAKVPDGEPDPWDQWASPQKTDPDH